MTNTMGTSKELHSNASGFKTLEEVCLCVEVGMRVHWKNSGYLVTLDDKTGRFNITFIHNGSAVGLYHLDNINSDYNPKDFFSYCK